MKDFFKSICAPLGIATFVAFLFISLRPDVPQINTTALVDKNEEENSRKIASQKIKSHKIAKKNNLQEKRPTRINDDINSDDKEHFETMAPEENANVFNLESNAKILPESSTTKKNSKNKGTSSSQSFGGSDGPSSPSSSEASSPSADEDVGLVQGTSEQSTGAEESKTVGTTTTSNTPAPSLSENDDDAPELNANKASGTYGSLFDVLLTSTESGNITYCVSYGGACCDPHATGQIYSSKVNIGASGDGSYCLKAFATDASGNESDDLSLAYIVNTSLPSLSYNFDLQQVQSNELNLIGNIQSNAFGQSGIYYDLRKLPTDPALIFPADSSFCKNIDDNYSSDSTAIFFDELFSIDQLDLASQGPGIPYELYLGDQNLDYGINYLVHMLIDTNPMDGMRYTCPTQQVTLKDFEVFDFSAGSRAPASAAGTIDGGFVGFGHFETSPASPSNKGPGEATSASTVLESALTTIIN